MIGLYVNILCWIDVLFILENYHPWDFNRNHLFWSLFLAVRSAILLKRDYITGEYCRISSSTCFEVTQLHTVASENNIKKFIGRATGHNDHYMINMNGQRPNTGSNWTLTGAYLQRWCVFVCITVLFFYVYMILLR